MPSYRRRRYYRRFNRFRPRRRRFYRRRYIRRNLASRYKEIKYLSDGQSDIGLSDVAPVYINTTVIPRGTGPQQRIGRKIMVKSIQIQMWFRLPKGGGPPPEITNDRVTIMWALVRRTGPGANPAGATEVYQNVAGSFGAPQATFFRNMDQTKMYRVFRKGTFILDIGNLTEKRVAFTVIRRRGLPVVWSNADTFGSLFEYGTIFMMMWSTAPNTVDDRPLVDLGYRVRYTDA